MIADCGFWIADLKMGSPRKTRRARRTGDWQKLMGGWAIESEHKGLGAHRDVSVSVRLSRRKEVGRGWKCWQHGPMSLPRLVRRRGPVGVQSSSAARLGRCRGFTRAVLECLNGNFRSLFGHAVVTAGEPEYVFRFICLVLQDA